MNNTDTLFRFLLRPGRWVIEGIYDNNSIPIEALNEAIKDLKEDNENNISTFLIEKESNQNGISDLEIISFLYSASSRVNLSKLCYIDILFKDLKYLGFKVKKNPRTSNISFKFYAEKHYEIYIADYNKYIELAKLIFSYIRDNYSGNLPTISKPRLRELIPIIYLDPRVHGIDHSQFYTWAKP